MNRFKIASATMLLMLPLVSTAAPIATGDVVNVSWDFLAVGSPQCGPGDVKTTAVAADASDAVTVLDCAPGFITVSIDMNQHGFTSDWTLFNTGFFGDPFDGIVISNIDWVHGVPSDVIVDTNVAGWDAFGVSTLTADSMQFNFSGIDTAILPADYYFNVRLVPEPGMATLLGIGLVAFGLSRRRRQFALASR